MPNERYRDDEESNSGHPGLSLLSIRRALGKQRIPIVVVWVVFTICTAAVVRMLPAVYLAESVVMIDSQKIPEKFVSATVATELEDRIVSIRQLLLSGGELKKLIEEFGLYREERNTVSEEEVLDMMRKDITVTVDSGGLVNEKGSSSKTKRVGAFRIGFQGPNPTLVMRVTNRMTDLYVEQNLKTRETQAAGTSDFLETQLREAKTNLDLMEATVSKYKLEHNGELPQQEHSLTAVLSRLQTELEVNRDAINRVQQTKVVLESNLNATEAVMAAQTRAWEQSPRLGQVTDDPQLPGQSPVKVNENKTSEVLQEQLEAMRGVYKETHPDVVALRRQIEQVKRIEASRKAANEAAETAAPKPVAKAARKEPVQTLREPPDFARTREQVTGLKAQLKGLDQELDNRKKEQTRILADLKGYQSRLERLPVREQEMALITRDYEMSKQNYKSLLDKKMAAEMSLNMERRQQSERFIILDRAQLPEKPIKPKRPLLYAGGAAASLLLGLLLGVGIELRKNVLLGEWELPEGTRVLARLPHIDVAVPDQPKAKSRSWFRRKKALENVSLTALLLVTTALLRGFSIIGGQ